MDIEGAFNMDRYIEKIKEEYPFFAALSLLYELFSQYHCMKIFPESHFQYASESQLFL